MERVANVTRVAAGGRVRCSVVPLTALSVRVGRDTVSRLAAAGETFALQVRDPSDLGAAISALKLARVDLLGLAAREGPDETVRRGPAIATPTVSSVVTAPGGPLFLVEHFPRTADLLEAIPDVVLRRLERAGVETADIDVPVRGGVLDKLDTTSRAVILRLFPRPRAGAVVLPPDWLDFACEWVTGDLDNDEVVRLRTLGVEFDVGAADVSTFVHECGLAKAWCDAVNGELGDRIRVASVTFGRLPHLAIGAGGPQVDNAGLVNRYRLLQEVARELAADVAYGCIDFEPTLEGLALGLSPDGWQAQGGASPNVVARELITDRVPDAFPYQVLGREHVRRLGEVRFAYESLSDGHIEISIDEPTSWLPEMLERDDAQALGWEILAPCLVREDELEALLSEREQVDVVELGTHESADLLDAAVDLDSITLERSAHPRRGTRLTLLELVSWLNHEPHSDAPASVSPALATFGRWLAAGLDDPDRQALKSVAPRLIGTGPATPEEDRARQWMATHWLVRVQAPAWLRAAGMHEAAQRLEALDRLTIDLELVRAVDILGTAITIASRRLDITASIATDEHASGTVPDEEIVWEAWERVAETTGYVAASEAATHGAPAELTYATDLRVIECSRDPRVRDELDAARQSVGDTVWTTALHAVADEAWERAWRAADQAARELSGFTIRVEMGRIAKTMAWGGSEEEESLLDAADQAARDSLTRAALVGGAYTDEHPWDAARNAARSSEGGKPWSVLSDEARRTIGEDGWAQAMADARAVVTDVLNDAPDTVARVVVAAVAREASSAAARGVALRALAVARAQGGDYDEIRAAANEALQRIAIGLQAEAIALLDRLIDVEAATVAPIAH